MTLETPRSQNWTDLCLDAVRTTTECADWCIQNNHDADCTRYCLDAGTLATAAGRLTTREAPYTRTVLEATAQVLEQCGNTCNDHRDTHHVFARCADTCLEAAKACNTVAQRQA